jgi:transposase
VITTQRAHSLLLSSHRYSVPIIAETLGVCRQSISQWIKAWNHVGLGGLIEERRSGRPRQLSIDVENEVVEKILISPRGIKRRLAEITFNPGISIGKETLRRRCKRARLNWKRVDP